MLIEVAPQVHESAAKLYGSPEEIVAAYDDYTDEELEIVLRFQQFGREWLVEHLARLDELKPQLQPRPAAASARRPARSRRRPS